MSVALQSRPVFSGGMGPKKATQLSLVLSLRVPWMHLCPWPNDSGSREPQERNVPELASFPEKGRHSVGVLGLPALVLWVAEKGFLTETAAPPWIGCALQHQKERQRQWEG